ncbi:MAG: carboxypeptidase-like regulatory domain-containing protein [Bacteroidales bacterium]|nr:carboxypeptidase-like regulatory domain-containing protein [Bacteroidales bacterium]
MKHIFFSIIFFFSVIFSHAQVIQGTVYDSKTRETLPGVVIFFDGTSIVTTSDYDGKFRFVLENKINANLVLSHLSYESLVIEKPFEHRGESFFLKEKTNTIQAAVVTAEYDPFRAQRMHVFKNFFLGESVAAKSCAILNEDDIILRYDNLTNILHASARNPLIVENRHLGYRITIEIQNFQVKYTYTHTPYTSPNTSNVGSSFSARNPISFELAPMSFSYKINYFFVDQGRYDISLTRRRNEIYERSRQYFWTSLITNFALKESGFKIFNMLKEIHAEDYFLVIDDPTQNTKEVLLMPDTDLNRKHREISDRRIYGVMGIRCKKNIVSEVIFMTNRFSVDHFGNIATSGIVYLGDMSNQRVGDMLPRDFTYTPSRVPRRLR